MVRRFRLTRLLLYVALLAVLALRLAGCAHAPAETREVLSSWVSCEAACAPFRPIFGCAKSENELHCLCHGPSVRPQPEEAGQ